MMILEVEGAMMVSKRRNRIMDYLYLSSRKH